MYVCMYVCMYNSLSLHLLLYKKLPWIQAMRFWEDDLGIGLFLCWNIINSNQKATQEYITI